MAQPSTAEPRAYRKHLTLQEFMDKTRKSAQGRLVTPVTDLTSAQGKTLSGDLRSCPAIRPRSACCVAGDGVAPCECEGFSCNCSSSDAATRSARAAGSIPAFIWLDGTSMR